MRIDYNLGTILEVESRIVAVSKRLIVLDYLYSMILTCCRPNQVSDLALPHSSTRFEDSTITVYYIPYLHVIFELQVPYLSFNNLLGVLLMAHALGHKRVRSS